MKKYLKTLFAVALFAWATLFNTGCSEDVDITPMEVLEPSVELKDNVRSDSGDGSEEEDEEQGTNVPPPPPTPPAGT
ncbi:hypothetical protein [Roseivirga sp. UBA838]|uniref:hypothetical protein n=1 Tax=Roseivirga sp. UBA838 TaxID=1947393 RepID=UPI00257C771B|nr:hypothetical protein [Roseivirga sp. UBA838]|tara:strand:- start:7226 stop:7456 length:231 start_codon:yes stop_codon:yes gene_type:complete